MHTINRFLALFLAASLVCFATHLSAQDSSEQIADVNPRRIESGNLMIAWTEGNDQLAGFSRSKGTWKTLAIQPVKNVAPIVGSDVGCVVIHNAVAAYSATAGRWDVLPVSAAWQKKEDGIWPVTVDGSLVQVQDGEHLYTFAASAGHWTSPTNPEFQPSQSLEMTLNSSNPRTVLKELEQWMQAQDPLIVANLMLSNNKVTIHAPRRSWVRAVEGKLAELDVPLKEDLAKAAQGLPAASESATANNRSLITDLQAQLQNVEQQAATLAQSLKDNPQPDDAERQDLVRLVEEAFQLRQKLQLADVERMALKLQTLRASIESREQNRDRIVQRRIDELLDPSGAATSWNPRSHDPAATPHSPPETGTPIRLPGAPALYIDFAEQSQPMSPGSSGRDNATNWREPVEIVSQLRTLRQRAIANSELLHSKYSQFGFLSKPLAEMTEEQRRFVGSDDGLRMVAQESFENEARLHRAALASKIADWKTAWSMYQTQLRLRQLDVKEAEVEWNALEENLGRQKKLATAALATPSEVRQLATQATVARIRLERAVEILKLYEDIAAQEPELDPATFKETP